jgi:hypothetical protein
MRCNAYSAAGAAAAAAAAAAACRSDLLLAVVLVGADVVLSVGCVAEQAAALAACSVCNDLASSNTPTLAGHTPARASSGLRDVPTVSAATSNMRFP